MQEQVKQLRGEKKSLEETIENTEVQKNMLSEKLNNLNDEKAKMENSIEVLRKEKEHIEMERRSVISIAKSTRLIQHLRETNISLVFSANHNTFNFV